MSGTASGEFLDTIETIRQRARAHRERRGDRGLPGAGFIGDRDPTTRRMLEEILATEEEHAQDLATLLETLDPTSGSS